MNTNEYTSFFDDIKEDDLEYFRFLMSVSESLAEIRQDKGLTQADAADIAGTSQAMISKYERGDYNPSIGKLWKYVHALGVEFQVNFKEKVDLADYTAVVSKMREFGKAGKLIRQKKETNDSWGSTGVTCNDMGILKGVAV